MKKVFLTIEVTVVVLILAGCAANDLIGMLRYPERNPKAFHYERDCKLYSVDRDYWKLYRQVMNNNGLGTEIGSWWDLRGNVDLDEKKSKIDIYYGRSWGPPYPIGYMDLRGLENNKTEVSICVVKYGSTDYMPKVEHLIGYENRKRE